MPRNKHPKKELEAVLKEAEHKGWTVSRGKGYWKMRCPNECKCFKTVKLSPSGSRYKTNLLHFLDASTCWSKP